MKVSVRQFVMDEEKCPVWIAVDFIPIMFCIQPSKTLLKVESVSSIFMHAFTH